MKAIHLKRMNLLEQKLTAQELKEIQALPLDLISTILSIIGTFKTDPETAQLKQTRKMRRSHARNVRKRHKVLRKIVRDKKIPSELKVKLIDELFPED